MPDRIQLKRTKGWRMPPNTVNVTRPRIWGNPFVKVKKNDGFWWVECRDEHYHYMPSCFRHENIAAYEAVESYQQWLVWSKEGRMVVAAAKVHLRGKTLACWCPHDAHCHAEILLEVANA
jgi:hypothetical protein